MDVWNLEEKLAQRTSWSHIEIWDEMKWRCCCYYVPPNVVDVDVDGQIRRGVASGMDVVAGR